MSEHYNNSSQQNIYSSPDRFMDALDRHIEKNNTEDQIKEEAYEFLSATQIIETEYPKEQWLVDRMIPKDGITCLGGLPATMKSYFSNYLAIQIASGKMVLDKHKTEQANVLFIDKENKLSRIKDRILRLGISTEAAKNIYFLKSNFIIDNDRDLAAVCAFVRDHQIKLVFIDTLVRTHNHEENSASEMNKVFLAFKEILLAGSGICFLHHFNKRGGFGMSIDVRDQLRGSGDILAMVDSFIALTKKENFIEVEQAKSRDEELIPKFLIQPVFNENKTTFNYLRDVEKDERIDSLLIADVLAGLLSANTYTRKFLLMKGEEAGYKRASIDNAIAQLKKEGRIIAYKNGTGEYMYSINRQESIN